MKIIIDIPEELLEHIKNKSEDSNDEFIAMRAIANSTPLPKGHGRLIDADAYIDRQEDCGWLDDIPISEFNRIAPTIIEADKEEEGDTNEHD